MKEYPRRRKRGGSEKEKPKCPQCGSERVRKYLYGLLDPGFAARPDFDKLYIAGGCLIWPDSPHYHCDECGTDFRNANKSD